MSPAGAKRGVTIREMDIDDLPAVYHLGEALFTREDFPMLYRTWDEYEVTAYFNSDPQYCLVAEDGEDVVGFIMGTTFERGTAWKYGYVAWVGVREDFQRGNLGRRLHAEIERRMLEDGVRMMLVDTESDNEEAIKFFERTGYSRQRMHVWMTKVLHKVKGKPLVDKGFPQK